METPAPGEARNLREQWGFRMRVFAFSLVLAPACLVSLLFYLKAARRGLGDRWAPFSYASVAITMAVLPLWLLIVFKILG
ncbi:MAG: hypothetical protein DWQ01_11405 [Planctomycetota bacterium]|nr:MAG: hypothetical protein DWQ01_11405 [Planctomycetota bacterium]